MDVDKVVSLGRRIQNLRSAESILHSGHLEFVEKRKPQTSFPGFSKTHTVDEKDLLKIIYTDVKTFRTALEKELLEEVLHEKEEPPEEEYMTGIQQDVAEGY